MAALAAALALPRPVEPTRIPPPVIARAELVDSLELLARQAHDAEKHPLSHPVRAVGESLRQFGRRTYEDPRGSTEMARQRWRRQLEQVRRAEGDLPILRLRAVQAYLFVKALDRWEKTGRPDTDLIELGGDFTKQAGTQGYVRQGRLLASREERLAMFLLRWTDWAGLRDTPEFRVPRALELSTLRFRVMHPEREGGDSTSRLGVVERIAALTPEYPVDLAQGIVLVQGGNWAGAVQAFERQLRAHPDGPWALWARNYILFSRAHNPIRPDPSEW
jgi:hypothetical protein